jgi:hypothetical protein
MQQNHFGIRERENTNLVKMKGLDLNLTLNLHLGLENEVEFLHVCLGSELMVMKR